MTDPVFRRATRTLPLAAVADAARCALPAGADPTLPVVGLSTLGGARAGTLAVAAADTPLDELRQTRAGICLVAPSRLGDVPRDTIALVADDPAAAFQRVARLIDPDSVRPRRWTDAGQLHAPAFVHAEARLEPGVALGPGVIVGPGAEIGTGTALGAGSYVDADVRIGRECAIDVHVSLFHALIGDRVVVHAGARIGAIEPGAPRLGRVILQDDVEIGANAVVMRGGGADTVVGEGAVVAPGAIVATDQVMPRKARF